MRPISSPPWARRVAATMILAAALAASAAAEVADPLGVPGPIEFDGKSYVLAWSSAPTETYAKQEYVPAGQAVARYEQLLLVEMLTGDLPVMDAVKAQMDLLNRRKADDPLVNMDLIRNEATGEVLLDFIVSSRDAGGEFILEWNAYRYAPHETSDGKRAVLLFAISHRAYGDDASRAFLERLRSFRPTQINALASAEMPLPAR